MTAGGTPASLAYRPEIDGLRAIAVVAVILCHAGVSWLPGGYLGVDLFFVISGYLITGILAAELAEGRFSIARFYMRRVRRILPALMLVTLLCVPLALWLMLPEDLALFGQTMVATALFANNMLLALLGSYWGPDTQFFPLVHSWSLGVEEQYYLLVPLLMWAGWGVGGMRVLIVVIVLLSLLSFAARLSLEQTRPGWAFYLIVSRGWELGAGSLVALVESRVRPLAGPRTAATLAALGLAMAVAIMVVTPLGAASPKRTLVPVAGMCLVLLFGGTRDPAGRLLTLRPMIWTGLISYSLYLFHQPAFAFLRLATLERPGVWAHVALIPPVFLLAWASWRFVEQPFRNPARVPTRTVLAATGAATLAAIGVGAALIATAGLDDIRPEFARTAQLGRDVNILYNYRASRYRATPLPQHGKRAGVLVIGDSFSRDFINMGLESGGLRNQDISLAQDQPCLPLPPATQAQARRADFIVLAYSIKPDLVPCIARLAQTFRSATAARVIVIGRKQFGWNNSPLLRIPEPERWNLRVAPQPDAVAVNAAMRRLLDPAVFVDVERMIGDAQGRVPLFTPGRRLISYDLEHLTPDGARYLGELLFRHPALAALARAGYE